MSETEEEMRALRADCDSLREKLAAAEAKVAWLEVWAAVLCNHTALPLAKNKTASEHPDSGAAIVEPPA